MKNNHVYWFTDGKLLGGKGANLCEMTQIGINVPPGFVITTEACLDYLDQDRLPVGLMESVREQIGKLETATNKTFGSALRTLKSTRCRSRPSSKQQHTAVKKELMRNRKSWCRKSSPHRSWRTLNARSTS